MSHSSGYPILSFDLVNPWFFPILAEVLLISLQIFNKHFLFIMVIVPVKVFYPLERIQEDCSNTMSEIWALHLLSGQGFTLSEICAVLQVNSVGLLSIMVVNSLIRMVVRLRDA